MTYPCSNHVMLHARDHSSPAACQFSGIWDPSQMGPEQKQQQRRSQGVDYFFFTLPRIICCWAAMPTFVYLLASVLWPVVACHLNRGSCAEAGMHACAGTYSRHPQIGRESKQSGAGLKQEAEHECHEQPRWHR